MGLTYRLPAPSISGKDGEEEEAGEEEEESAVHADHVRHRAMRYTGPRAVLRHDRLQEEALSQFEAGMAAMIGSCRLCRVKGRPFDHAAAACSRRHAWLREKKAVLRDCETEGRPWMEKYTACFLCYMPQTICRRADPDAGEERGECQYKDLVLPLCYGAFFTQGLRAMITREFRRFGGIREYMRWLGVTGSLGGEPCVQAIQLAARLLSELR
jgi:hypothetical protein